MYRFQIGISLNKQLVYGNYFVHSNGLTSIPDKVWPRSRLPCPPLRDTYTSTCSWELIWKQDLYRYNQGNSAWDHPRFWVIPKSINRCSCKRKERETWDTERHKQEITWRQRERPKLCWCKPRSERRLPKLEQARQGSPLVTAEAVWTCKQPDFSLLDSTTVTEKKMLF